jgi:hypothetical protein
VLHEFSPVAVVWRIRMEQGSCRKCRDEKKVAS